MIKIMIFSIVLIFALLDVSSAAYKRNSKFPPRPINNKRVVAAYFSMDNEPSAAESKPSTLRNLPPYINTLFLKYADPTLQYEKGSYNTVNTGLNMRYDGKAFAETMVSLKRKNITVILSIGGKAKWKGSLLSNNEPQKNSSLYTSRKYDQIKDFVDDFALDGVEWDYQPNGNSFADQQYVLNEKFHFAEYIQLISETRKVMPKSKGYIVCAAPSGVGALGGKVNNDASSPYNYTFGKSLGSVEMVGLTANLWGLPWTGHFIPVLEIVGDQLDLVNYREEADDDRGIKYIYDAWAYYGKKYGFIVAAGVRVKMENYDVMYQYNNKNVAKFSKYILGGGEHSYGGAYDGITVSEITNMNEVPDQCYKFCIISYMILNQENSESDALAVAAEKIYHKQYDGRSSIKDLIMNDAFCGVEPWVKGKHYQRGTQVYYNRRIYKSRYYGLPKYIPGRSYNWYYLKSCYQKPVEKEGRSGYQYNPNGATFKIYETGVWDFTFCGIPQWTDKVEYPKGSKVYYNGKIWENKYKMRKGRLAPGASWFSYWKILGSCDHGGVALPPWTCNVKPWKRKMYFWTEKVYHKQAIWQNSKGWVMSSQEPGKYSFWDRWLNSKWYKVTNCDSGKSANYQGAGANENMNSDDNSGSIIPIVIPVLVVLTLVLAALGFYYQRRKKSNEVKCIEEELI